MGCCGVPGRVDPETYLRLDCERSLLSHAAPKGMRDGFEGVVIGRALSAAGTLSQAAAREVLDEYALAMALRDRNRGRMLLHRRHVALPPGERLTAQRVVLSGADFGQGGQRWTLQRVRFADDATHLDLSGTMTMPVPSGPMARRRMGLVHAPMGGRAQHPHPLTLALGDDRGTTATGHAGQSSWGGAYWEARYVSDAPLSPDTEWVEVDGSRIDLPARRPAPSAHVEEIEPVEPLRAVLYGEILSTDRLHGGDDSFDIACRALVATGALAADDPFLSEVRRIAGAVSSASPVPGLPAPWGSLLSRFSKADGVSGTLAIGAVIEDLDGFSIRLDALTSEQTSFSVALAISPGTPLLRHFPGLDLDVSPITWWAEDDRMNTYVAFADRSGGGGNVAEGQVTSLAPLDPTATELTLLPTAARARGVVTVPLADLAARP
jgi:hypothetical protein